jgi:uncharacterized protein (TIGR03083 family)
MPIDTAAAYLDGKRSLEDAVGNATPEELQQKVPACPLWTVTDVVRHLTGIAGDLAGGTLPTDFNPIESWQTDAGKQQGNAYTDDHVATRSDRSLAEVLDEWGQNTERMLPILRGEQSAPQPFPFVELVPVNDLAVHLHDVRGALRQPKDRDAPLVSLAFASYVAAFAMRLNARGLPPVRIRYDGGKERVTGEGDVAATWTGDRFELFRALAGRRSNEQIAAMRWEGDPSPYVPLVSMYGPRDDALVE